MDAAIYGARAAYIGGASGTATVMAGQEFRIPVNGTMAHSWIMYFKDEYEAFRRYAEVYPDNVVLLVDTYDVLHSGVPNAITAKSDPVFGAVYKIAAVDAEETVDLSSPYRYVDPEKPWKNRHFDNCTMRKLQELVIKEGRRVIPVQSLDEIREYVKKQLNTEIWPEEQRFENPHKHFLDMSPAYYEMKMNLLDETRNL